MPACSHSGIKATQLVAASVDFSVRLAWIKAGFATC